MSNFIRMPYVRYEIRATFHPISVLHAKLIFGMKCGYVCVCVLATAVIIVRLNDATILENLIML